MKHLLLIALLASMFSGSVFAKSGSNDSDEMGETEAFECPMLAESNDRLNTKLQSEELLVDQKPKGHSAVGM